MTEYVVYHKTCGHIAGICNDREMAEAQQSMLAAVGRFGWLIRTGASGDDFRALLRQDQCETCGVTGR